MEAHQKSKSLEIRQRLNHPILDADGHWLEFNPALFDYLRDVAGNDMVTRYRSWQRNRSQAAWYDLSPAERRDRRALRPVWWAVATKNTLDRATATLPKLLYERLDETGIDFAVLYPSIGLSASRIEEEDLRRAVCRAFNRFSADAFREYSDRMTPAAVIPMHSPQEAIEELEYAVKTLGLKALFMADYAKRPIPYVEREFGEEAGRFAFWLDFFCLDSEYEYDPVCAKCVELKVVPGFHSTGFWGSRTSPSNFMYNHIGHFRLRVGSGLQGAVHGWRDATLPEPEIYIFGMRRRLGLQPLRRSDWPLGKAESRGNGKLQPGHSQRGDASRAGPQVWRQDHRRKAE